MNKLLLRGHTFTNLLQYAFFTLSPTFNGDAIHYYPIAIHLKHTYYKVFC